MGKTFFNSLLYRLIIGKNGKFCPTVLLRSPVTKTLEEVDPKTGVKIIGFFIQGITGKNFCSKFGDKVGNFYLESARTQIGLHKLINKEKTLKVCSGDQD